MRIHFIAIGGAIMHQLAITLSKKGHRVSGSDDVINDPAKSNLEKEGILPAKIGFFAENITSDIEVVVLGMHAKFDNIELTNAMELGIKVYSFPEYIYEQSKEKRRVVIAGSHGKTTITSMIMHALRHQNMDFDYLVGSSVKGFEHSVKISDAPIIILEGDEYLASSLTKEPKFIYYKGNLAVLSGIEWDHVNVFKTEAIYFEQFQKLVKSLESDATLFYFNTPKIAETIKGIRNDISLISYQSGEYTAHEDKFILKKDDATYSFDFFGKHNMENLEAAKNICVSLGMNESDFYTAMQSFTGAGRRLEKLVDEPNRIVFKDFAHSPSKLTATVKAVSEKYPSKTLIACYEMHTYSTLTASFLPQYHGAFGEIKHAVVFIDKDVVEKKGNQIFSKEEIISAFGNSNIEYFTQKDDLENYFESIHIDNPVFLMMSSGTFGGIDLSNIGLKKKLTSNLESPTTDNESTSSPIEQAFFQNYQKKPTAPRPLLVMICASMLFFILPSLFFLWRYKDNEDYYPTIAACFNFQVMISIGLLIFAGMTIFFPFGNFLFLIGLFFFHAYNLYKGAIQLANGEPLNISKGILVLLPKK